METIVTNNWIGRDAIRQARNFGFRVSGAIVHIAETGEMVNVQVPSLKGFTMDFTVSQSIVTREISDVRDEMSSIILAALNPTGAMM